MRVTRRDSSRRTRNRTAPPSCVALPGVPLTSSAALRSRASPIRRTDTAREMAGAPSSTTSAKAPLRSSTSAHQAPRSALAGRTITSCAAWSIPPHACAPPVPRAARVIGAAVQSRGSSVRDASTTATLAPSAIARATSRRRIVVTPLPATPTSSLNRPRGSPPAIRRASSPGIPVGSPGAAGRSGATTVASCWRSRASDMRRRHHGDGGKGGAVAADNHPFPPGPESPTGGI